VEGLRARDGREWAPTTLGGDACDVHDTACRLGLRASPVGAGYERDGDPVAAALQQPREDHCALSGILALAVEGAAELRCLIDQTGALERLVLDQLEVVVPRCLDGHRRPPEQVRGDSHELT